MTLIQPQKTPEKTAVELITYFTVQEVYRYVIRSTDLYRRSTGIL